MWPQHSTYFGGGLFETNDKVWVNPDYGGWARGERFEAHFQPPTLEADYDHPFYDHDAHHIFRMERDGWRALKPHPAGSVPNYRVQSDGTYLAEPSDPDCPLLSSLSALHEKPNPKPSSPFSLIMTSLYFYSSGEPGESGPHFEVRNNATKTSIALEGAVWADWDEQGRLVYATAGKIFAAEIGANNELEPKELADFNDMRPHRTKSPAWARKW